MDIPSFSFSDFIPSLCAPPVYASHCVFIPSSSSHICGTVKCLSTKTIFRPIIDLFDGDFLFLKEAFLCVCVCVPVHVHVSMHAYVCVCV